jgi:hypothetical protein
MSASSSAGLVGDSIHSTAQSSSSFIAAITASVSAMSTSRLCRRPRASKSASAITVPL